MLSILLKSLNPRWILANAPWLAGSGLTVFLDLFVLGQFIVFSWQDERRKTTSDEVDTEEEDA